MMNNSKAADCPAVLVGACQYPVLAIDSANMGEVQLYSRNFTEYYVIPVACT